MIIHANAHPCKILRSRVACAFQGGCLDLTTISLFDFLTFGVASASLEISFVIFEIGWAWNWVDIRSGVIWVRERAYGLLIFFSPFLCFAHNDRSPFRLDPMDHIVLISEKKKGSSCFFGSPPRNLYLGGSFFFSFDLSFVFDSPCTMVCDNWVDGFSLWKEGIACTKWMGWDGFFLPGFTFFLLRRPLLLPPISLSG